MGIIQYEGKLFLKCTIGEMMELFKGKIVNTENFFENNSDIIIISNGTSFEKEKIIKILIGDKSYRIFKGLFDFHSLNESEQEFFRENENEIKNIWNSYEINKSSDKIFYFLNDYLKKKIYENKNE